MDKNSVPETRQSCKLKMGLDEFVQMYFADKSVDAKMICPCKICGDESSVAIKVTKDHLKSVGLIKGYSRILGTRMTSMVRSQSQTSDENKTNVMEETIDIKLFKDFLEQLLPSGLKGREVHDSIAKFLHSETDADKSISMLLEFTKELSQEGADPPKSLSEMLPVLGCEEEDKTTLREERSQQSASTSSGSVGYSPKEENRRKLREKINKRKESRTHGFR